MLVWKLGMNATLDKMSDPFSPSVSPSSDSTIFSNLLLPRATTFNFWVPART